MMDDTKVPVVAVVGFLPASKEGNLLKHILTGEHGKRVAVVRYADCLGVDGAELERCTCSQCVVDGVDLVETANGCAVACCRRHGDLAAALKKLKARQGCHLFSRLDKIIIEGADACDAADVHVAFLDEEVATFARLDAIVSSCVEINQCVGCTRQFFIKSFLGDDAAVLARSSGEEPVSPRH